MGADPAGSPDSAPDTEPARRIVHVTHTAWAAVDGDFRTRLRRGVADDELGRVLLEQLQERPVEMRDPATVPSSRMFHALSWLAQQGYELEVRERLEQTEAQRRTGHATRRRQWRLAPSAQAAATEQPSLF